MEYKQLEKKIVTIWRISASIFLCFNILLFVGVLGLNYFFPLNKFLFMCILWVYPVLLLFQVLALLIIPKLRYKRWAYALAEDRVGIKRGLFFITESIIPIVRIQHINVSQGPVARKLQLYTVSISLASSTFEIPGLSKEVSKEISVNLNKHLYARLEAGGVK